MSTAIPFHGLEPFVLGRTREQIKALAGEPDAIHEESFADGNKDELWFYKTLGVEAAFSDTDDWRLASITVDSPDVLINGVRLIGLPVSELVEAAGKAGITDVDQTDDFEESGLCYTSDSHGLMLWAMEGVVVNITLFPRYDESGEEACWPA